MNIKQENVFWETIKIFNNEGLEYDKERIKSILNKLSKKEQRIIESVCKENYIDIF